MYTEEILVNVIRNIDDIAIIVTDNELLIKYMNPFAEKFFQYNKENLINRKILTQIHQEKNVSITRFIKGINIARKYGKYKFELKTKEGKILDATVVATKDITGKLDSYILVGKDITLQYQREHLLKLITETSRLFLETTNWIEIADIFLKRLIEILKYDNFCLLKKNKGKTEIIKQYSKGGK